MWVVWLGAVMAICGLVYLAYDAIRSRRLSTPPELRRDGAGTLEPRRQGVGFLGIGRNWPGAAMFVVGMGLLLVGAAA